MGGFNLARDPQLPPHSGSVWRILRHNKYWRTPDTNIRQLLLHVPLPEWLRPWARVRKTGVRIPGGLSFDSSTRSGCKKGGASWGGMNQRGEDCPRSRNRRINKSSKANSPERGHKRLMWRILRHNIYWRTPDTNIRQLLFVTEWLRPWV